MDYYFRTEEGELVNVIDHTISQLATFPDNLRIYIATDSQNYGGKTVYVTVVVYRYGVRGAHYIYKKDRIPRIRDHFSRLWKEAELTVEVADIITGEIPVISIEALEFDYNNKKVTKSSSLVAATKGWAESLGYKVKVKPDEMIAAKAADHLCRA